MDDDSRKDRWERRTEVPLAVASLICLASYAVHVLARALPTAGRDTCLALILATWAVFAVDYTVRRPLSGQRLRFVRTHWPDTVVLVLPLLRPGWLIAVGIMACGLALLGSVTGNVLVVAVAGVVAGG